ncbi:PREDICTED: U3 small nucleolar RNA-associated protein 4 homolog [Rhagoletis zephyria]|uniref:U3 small nucleolar RNA-associated protein 4 homolog n=1 Tax=Rhagoletis zephyria TaxID=28612 RepID=UPI000811754F|nr:PREDICTED: U3 small nucleolar RNA-associated protein 4 homolog [Rhagoletis zephyria]
MNSKKVEVGSTRTHNVRFYNLSPRSIQSMAYNKLFHKLAITRNDGSIEIWDMQYSAYLEKVIPKSPGNSVEGMAWAGERFFSVGLTGELVEWDLHLLKPRRKQFVTGNAIWCIDINSTGTELVVGTEEGYINIFEIDNDQMQYKNLFDKQEGRVLCCKFDRTGEFLVTGSLGAIRIWDVKSGHALHKMTVARAERKKEVIVWSLQVLSDFTIVSGDSRGQVTVWDGKMATQLESHQVLKADVLTVAINEEENMLMCSGIEPIIRIYAKTKIKREDTEYNCWVKYLQRSVHDNDVKALICAGDRIYSGGMDGYLGISSASKRVSTIAKYGPFLKNPCVVVSPNNRLLLLRYTNYLEIWRLGSTDGRPQFEGSADDEQDNKPKHKNKAPERRLFALNSAPEKLLEFKSTHEEPIVCATISPDSQWLCYSTQKHIRLFRFVPAVAGKNDTQLARIKGLPEQFTIASHLTFTSDSRRLFLVQPNTHQIHVFSVVNNGSTDLDFVESIETSKHIKDVINLLAVSECGTYVVATGTDHTIGVWRIFQGKHYKHHLNMPRYSAITTALAIHAKEPRLVAAFSDGKIIEYDLEEMCFTCSEQEYFVDNAETHCVSNVLVDKRNPNHIILHNDAYLYVLEKTTSKEGENGQDEDAGETPKKKAGKKFKRVNSDNKVSGLRLKFKKSFEHLISLWWLSTDELVAVGVNPITLIEQLPDVFKQKKFGTS